MRSVKLTLVSLLALLLVACGGDDEKKPAATPASASPWLALLGAAPDTSETRKYVVMNDYEAARKATNEKAPLDPAAVAEYRRKLNLISYTATPSHISGLGQYFDPHLWSSQVGFHAGQVDADLQTGQPPNDVQALRGRFDSNAIHAAINKDTAPLRDVLTKTSREGATTYVWGDDNKVDPRNRSVLRPLGRGERLAVKGDMLFWTHSTPPLNDMIDASADKMPSLADAGDIKTLVAGLEKQSVYSVLISSETLTPETINVVNRDPSLVREAREASFREALKPYTMLAIAYGQDAQGPFSTAILLHTSDALAQENVARFEAKVDTGRSAQGGVPWKDLITERDITADGMLLIAKLRTSRTAFLAQVFLERDSLFAHE
jgi:hypothetical protein